MYITYLLRLYELGEMDIKYKTLISDIEMKRELATHNISLNDIID